MKPKESIRISLQVVNWVYFACSILGILLYAILPPLLNSFGARFYVYLFYYAGLNDAISEGLRLFLHILMIIGFVTMLTLGLYSLIKKHYRVYTIIVIADILLTIVFIIWSFFQNGGFALEFQSGIILNIIYATYLCHEIYNDHSKTNDKEI